MPHLDKRMDPDKDADTSQGGRIKDGASGNVNESRAYEKNKTEDLPDGTAPDVVDEKGSTGAPRQS